MTAYFAYIGSSGLVVGTVVVQDDMVDYIEPPMGSTKLRISEVRYRDMNLNPGQWKQSGSDVILKQEVPATSNKAQITANGIDELTITGIPAGSEISIVGSGAEAAYQPVTDTYVTITSGDPGGIVISIRNPGYTEWRRAFNAV